MRVPQEAQEAAKAPQRAYPGDWIGFDLDLTLVDSRPGIGLCLSLLAEQTGTHIDVPLALSRIGPPIEVELANWFPSARVPEATAAFRTFMAHSGIQACQLMEGAAHTVETLRSYGINVMVVTAKPTNLAAATLHAVNIHVDAIAGGLWHLDKATALMQRNATTYVGDHVADIDAAKQAGAYAIAVATGSHSTSELVSAGADLVVADLVGLGDRLIA